MPPPSKQTTQWRIPLRKVNAPSALPPGEYFQIIPWGNAEAVVRVGPHGRRHPGPALNRKEVEERLRNQCVPMVPGYALSSYLGSFQFLPGFDRYAPQPFSKALPAHAVGQSKWRGPLGEVSMQRGKLIPPEDLNKTLYENFEVFDLRERMGGSIHSVKTSLRPSGEQTDRFKTYLRGLGESLGSKPSTYKAAGAGLYPKLSPDEQTARLLRRGQLAINSDDVDAFRKALLDANNYKKKPYLNAADKVLAREPVKIAGKPYSSYQSLETASRNTSISLALRQQMQAALLGVRTRLAGRIHGNGLTTQHLERLQGFRKQIASANPQLTAEEIRRCTFPEQLLVARLGGRLGGHAKAAGLVGARGAMGGAAVSIMVEGGMLIYQNIQSPYQEQPDFLKPLARVGASGGAAGFLGAATENLTMATAGGRLSRSLMSQGAPFRAATLAGRGVGGAAAGGVAAPVFAMTSLALDDKTHTKTDYAAVGSRAFVVGGLSSAVSAGLVGMVWGSEVPVLGNIVGFVVGFGGYYALDALMGENVENGVRSELKGW